MIAGTLPSFFNDGLDGSIGFCIGGHDDEPEDPLPVDSAMLLKDDATLLIAKMIIEEDDRTML